MIPIWLDRPLPPEVVIAGVRLVNLKLNGTRLELDLANGFPPGPWKPAYWGG